MGHRLAESCSRSQAFGESRAGPTLAFPHFGTSPGSLVIDEEVGRNKLNAALCCGIYLLYYNKLWYPQLGSGVFDRTALYGSWSCISSVTVCMAFTAVQFRSIQARNVCPI